MQGQRLAQVSGDEFEMVVIHICVYSEDEAKMDIHKQVF